MVIVEVLLGLITPIIGVIAFVAASNANKNQAKAQMSAVDATAYERAQKIYEGALATLRTDLEDMRQETKRLRDSNDRLSESNDRLRAEISDLRAELVRMRGGTHGPS
jgi:ABC-type phosphate transport system auxiliary subunit